MKVKLYLRPELDPNESADRIIKTIETNTGKVCIITIASERGVGSGLYAQG